MRFSKFFQTMLLITALAIIYIYMQNKIYELAYRGKVKEKQIIKLSEINGVLAYEILRMKSAHNLGDKLLSANSSLKFRDPQNIVQLVASDAPAEGPLQAVSVSRHENPLLNLLAPRSAEAQDHENIVFRPWAKKR